MYRMISIDIDGTLLDDKGNLPLANLQAIRAAKKKGAHIILNTGKPAHTFSDLMDELTIDDAAISLTGGMIVKKDDKNSWNIIKGFPINLQAMESLAGLPLSSKVIVFVFTATKSYIYVPGGDEAVWNAFQELMQKTNFQPYELIDRSPLLIPEIIQEPVYKVCFNSHIENEVSELYSRMTRANIPDIDFDLSAFATIDIHASNTSKGKALEFLAGYYNIPKSQVMAFGDHETDMDAILWAGFGAVMSNAPDEVKLKAKNIAPSNQDCGVAKIINQYVLVEGSYGSQNK